MDESREETELLEAAGADEEIEGPNESWLVSYADMMTLLFGFFAMLYLTKGALVPIVPQKPPPPPVAQTAPVAPGPSVAQPAPPAPAPVATTEESGKGQATQGGGNRGFFILTWLPPELLSLLLAVTALYAGLVIVGMRPAAVPNKDDLDRIADPNAAPAQETPGTLALRAWDTYEDEFAELVAEQGVQAHAMEERWLISYADMMTLLFGFFAMLYLMGPNFEAVRKSMESTFRKGQVTESKPRFDLTPPPDVPLLPVQLPNPKDAVAPTPPPPVAVPALPAPVAQPAPVPPEPAAPVMPPPSATTVVATATPPAAPTLTLQEMEERQLRALRERLAKRGSQGSGQGSGQGKSTEAGTPSPAPATGTAGKGGKGIGGGRGNNVGGGSFAGAGSTICGEGAAQAYKGDCWGSGFFGCVADRSLVSSGGMNGSAPALEMYCVSGSTRVCLTWEQCPWRAGDQAPEDYPQGLQTVKASTAHMRCSPFGLPITAPDERVVFAQCKPFGNCGFSRLECDGNGNLFVY